MSDRPRQPSALERPHVVIVSDDPELQAFLGEGLVYCGLWTSGIGSALQSLEVFRLRSFDLMLVDANLGGPGAEELVRRLRGRSDRAAAGGPRTDIPILVVDAGPGDIALNDALAAGGDGVVTAPFDLDELASRLIEKVATWRRDHPDRPWADAAALGGARS